MSTVSASLGPRRSVILLLCLMLGCGGGDADCPVGLGIYASDSYRFRRVYEVLNAPQSVGSGLACEIHATVVGPATCDSTHALGALRLRSLNTTLIVPVE